MPKSKQPTEESGQVRARAAAKDILGVNAGQSRKWSTKKIPGKWSKHYNRLLELRDYHMERQGDSKRDAREEQPSFSLHMADAGTDSYDRDWALSRISSEQNSLYEIEEALRRIESGTYGVCEMTGEPIEEARLEAIPWTRFSEKAKQELENRGAFAKNGLAPLGKLGDASDSAEGDSDEAEESR